MTASCLVGTRPMGYDPKGNYAEEICRHKPSAKNPTTGQVQVLSVLGFLRPLLTTVSQCDAQAKTCWLAAIKIK